MVDSVLDYETIFNADSIYSPFKELVAYEYLSATQAGTAIKYSELFKKEYVLPSRILEERYGLFEPDGYSEVKEYVKEILGEFSVIFKGDPQYPRGLLKAKNPIELFYYRGDLGLLEANCVSIVGTRKISDEGIKRTRKLTSILVKDGYTIVSGLAKGVDTVALSTAIECSGRVIGVIGTPINEYYPKENKSLQDNIAKGHLLISQVPFFKYSKQPFKTKRFYFPARNITMAAISKATIIVEASDTSGTLVQARACIDQGKKLFILNSCFENKWITWPKTYEARGAIRVHSAEDILKHL